MLTVTIAEAEIHLEIDDTVAGGGGALVRISNHDPTCNSTVAVSSDADDLIVTGPAEAQVVKTSVGVCPLPVKPQLESVLCQSNLSWSLSHASQSAVGVCLMPVKPQLESVSCQSNLSWSLSSAGEIRSRSRSGFRFISNNMLLLAGFEVRVVLEKCSSPDPD